jgi:hypothetical protein
MADTPDIGAVPTQGVNKPASGTYGEKTALNNLQASLPTKEGAGAGGPQPPPVSSAPVRVAGGGPEGRPKTAAALPPGVPSALAAPTQQPGVPVGTPLDMGQTAAPVGNSIEQSMLILQNLASSPAVSADTREWAQMTIELIVEATRQ